MPLELPVQPTLAAALASQREKQQKLLKPLSWPLKRVHQPLQQKRHWQRHQAFQQAKFARVVEVPPQQVQPQGASMPPQPKQPQTKRQWRLKVFCFSAQLPGRPHFEQAHQPHR